jgi:WD40 repeat protein
MDGSTDTIDVWQLPSLLHTRLQPNHKDNLNNVCVSADGALLATSAWDGQIKVWNVASGAEIHTIKGQLIAYISLAFSPDGSRLAAGAWDGSVTLWDMSAWNQVGHWKAHAHYAIGTCFVAGGNVLITHGSPDKEWGHWETHVWAPPSFAEIEASDAITAKAR